MRESEVAQSCLTLSDPMDCSVPGSSVHEIFQARVLELGDIAFSSYLTMNRQSSGLTFPENGKNIQWTIVSRIFTVTFV